MAVPNTNKKDNKCASGTLKRAVGDGNTVNNLQQKKYNGQCIYWSFTYNNFKYSDANLLLEVLKSECEWVIFQDEIGDSGTLHLQGCLKLKKRKRLTDMKNLTFKEIHWEKTNKITHSAYYCYNSNKRHSRIWAYGFQIPRNHKIINFKIEKPYKWQQYLLDKINAKPHDRKIYWVYEELGNAGKSTFIKHCVCNIDGAIGPLSGKCNDIFRILAKESYIGTVLFDIPRCFNEDFINYQAIESIKNGMCCSAKYDSEVLVFNTPHIIVFANEKPNITKLSLDRWEIIEIMEDKNNFHKRRFH